MLWFLSFLVTGLLTAIAIGVNALGKAEVPVVSDAVRAVWPGGVGFSHADFFWIVGLQFACFVVAHGVIGYFYSFAGQETAVSPRDTSSNSLEPRGRLAVEHVDAHASKRWELAQFLFGNTSRGWAVLYAFLLTLILGVSFPISLNGWISPSYWGLSALFAITLWCTTIRPDRPESFAGLDSPIEESDSPLDNVRLMDEVVRGKLMR